MASRVLWAVVLLQAAGIPLILYWHSCAWLWIVVDSNSLHKETIIDEISMTIR